MEWYKEGETYKTNKYRDKEFFKKYLSGKVIDIGAGNNPVVKNAIVFDKKEGDANNILDYLEKEKFNCVYSSHCLEHVVNPKKALYEWSCLVVKGGYLIIIVPHEDLYEQHNWPSIMNFDHKHTFRLGNNTSWSPVSIDIISLVNELKGFEIVSSKVQDQNYNYDLIKKKKFKGNIDDIWSKIFYKYIIRKCTNRKIREFFLNIQHKIGYPIDQTQYNQALAQIEIIAKKIT